MDKILLITNEGLIENSGISRLQDKYIYSLSKKYSIDLIYRKGLKYGLVNNSFQYKNKINILILFLKALIKNKYKKIVIGNIIFFPILILNFFIGKKIFILIHYHELNLIRLIYRFLIKIFIFLQNNKIIFICSSNFTKLHLTKKIYDKKKIIKVIYPPLFLSHYHRLFKNKIIKEDFLLFIGRIDSDNYKGLKELVDCSKFLKTNVHIKVIGRGNNFDNFKKYYRKESSKFLTIEFLRNVSEDKKISLIRRSKSLILCGYGEGFGIVVSEAIALKTHVIVSSLDASSEISKKIKYGIIINPFNLKELASSISISNYHSISDKSYETFNNLIDISKFEKKVLSII